MINGASNKFWVSLKTDFKLSVHKGGKVKN